MSSFPNRSGKNVAALGCPADRLATLSPNAKQQSKHDRAFLTHSKLCAVERGQRELPPPKSLLLRLHGALAVCICGRFLGRITASLRLSRALEGHGMIAFAVKLGGSFVSLRCHLVIFGGFGVSWDWHWFVSLRALMPVSAG